MFIKHYSERKRAILIVQVDDIILTGDYLEEIKHLKYVLAQDLRLKI